MSIKILLADDSITIQKVVGIIFGGEEYCLTVVDNGKAAIDKALDLAPDILLVDALMPGISGYDVCEAIRTTPKLANTPILLLTGSFEPIDESRAQSCGADDFLAKPFEAQQILSKVQELYRLGVSRAASAQHPETEDFTQPPSTVEPFEPVESTEIIAFDTNDIWNAFTPAESGLSQETAPPEKSPVLPYAFEEPEPVVIEAEKQDAGETALPPFTEEQLKSAIAAVSRDVIERIVWEVVPGLAETLIKEAIARIKGENDDNQLGGDL